MHIDDLIAHLTAARAEHGNLPVVLDDPDGEFCSATKPALGTLVYPDEVTAILAICILDFVPFDDAAHV